MRLIKSDLKQLKTLFVLGQAGILLSALAVVFLVMIWGYREKVIHILLLRLDASTESMVAQLKANQVPLSSSQAHGVFIISQNDGAMVVDRHNDSPFDQELWASYKTKLLYEMQKQKRGWIVYPDKQWWNLNQQQRIIRYVPIDELGWILAAEVTRPTELALLSEVLRPSVYLTMIIVPLLGIAGLWLMTSRYFNIIRRYIARTLETNLMSLGGEEKVLESLPAVKESPQEDLQGEALGLGPAQQSAADAPIPKELPESRLPLKKAKELGALAQKRTAETHKAEVSKGHGKHDGASLDELTVNVNQISSEALKKAIQKFRNK